MHALSAARHLRAALAYPRWMANPSPPTSSSSLLVKVIVGAVVVWVALTALGWLVGAVIGVLRALALVTLVVAVIWAVLASIGRER